MTSAMCCPLQECDESATIFDREQRRARKDYECCECGADGIKRGELHEYISMLFDGAWSSWRSCLLCSEIGDHFSCGSGRVACTLWDDLEENFFPDMRMGGPCMEGLSPAAKMKLVERRMAWYFDQGEVDDDQWKDWPKNRDQQKPLLVVVERDAPVPYYETPEYYWARELELDKYRKEIK